MRLEDLRSRAIIAPLFSESVQIIADVSACRLALVYDEQRRRDGEGLDCHNGIAERSFEPRMIPARGRYLLNRRH